MQWFMANWKEVVLALLAIDTTLVPIFPNAIILKTIQKWLTSASQA